MALNDNFLQALGRITVNIQTLETVLSFITWSLIGPDQKVGMIITSQMSFKRLCNLLGALFRHKVQSPERVEELNDLLRRAATVEQRRNTVIHSTWSTSDEAGLPEASRFKITASRKKGLNIQSEGATLDDLNEIADEMREVIRVLISFMKSNHAIINYPTSPEA